MKKRYLLVVLVIIAILVSSPIVYANWFTDLFFNENKESNNLIEKEQELSDRVGFAAGTLDVKTTGGSNQLIQAKTILLVNDGSILVGRHSTGDKLVISLDPASGTPIFFDNMAGSWLPSIYLAGGKVGIGTSRPKTLLHINGDTTNINLEVQGAQRISANTNFENIGVLDIDQRGKGNILTLRDNSEEVFVVKDGGNVGIGTTTIGSKLTVAGTIESTTGGIKFPDGTTQSTASTSRLWSQSGYDIYYNNGNVGIGTASPSFVLDVHGSGATGADFTRITNTNSKGFADITINNDLGNRVVVGTGGSAVSIPVLVNNAYVTTGGTSSEHLVLAADGSNGVIRFLTAGIAAGNERVRIDTSGNVGIGTPSPADKLHIKDGNIRIESPSPIIRWSDNDAALNSKNFQIQDSNGVLIFGSNNDDWSWKNANMLVLNTNGNVGIGTTGPSRKLEVGGSSADEYIAISTDSREWLIGVGAGVSGNDAFTIFDSSAGDRFVINTNGNVGIGTTTPKTQMHITGDLYIDKPGGKIISKSANGTCHACGPDNTDNWVCEPIICP